MKRKSIIAMLIGAMGLGMVSTGCEDMLSPDSERHTYEVAQDTLYSYWGILKSLQNVAERYVVLGECRGDLVDSKAAYVSDTIQAMLDFDMESDVLQDNKGCPFLCASDYYHVINSCNAYLANVDCELKTGNKPYMMREAAQVEAIRAWVYLQLVQVYDKVPFYTQPLINTDEINAFVSRFNQEKTSGWKSAETWVDAQTLADKIAPSLKEAQHIEQQYGWPEYYYYGKDGHGWVHSQKYMIPINVLLGDLYLTKGGDKSTYLQAAQYYYNYFTANGMPIARQTLVHGGVIPANYEYTGHKGDGVDETSYDSEGKFPWRESEGGAPSTKEEAVTAIPSAKSKLWGTVLRNVNALFGFNSEITVHTAGNDSSATTVSNIILFPRYDKQQLYASNAYFKLCNSQEYEIYRGVNVTPKTDIEVDPNVGDARQYWAQTGYSQTAPNGVRSVVKFVTKQNPHMVFQALYPIIYRKGQLWLRYAEALNRAGYPSYAFAILKNGLCRNDDYYPEWGTNDFEVKEYTYSYTIPGTNTTIEHKVQAPEEDANANKTALIAKVQAYLNDDSYAVDPANITKKATDWQNWPDETTDKVLYYLNAREVRTWPTATMNLMSTYLAGNVTSQTIPLVADINQRSRPVPVPVSVNSNDPVTCGIHSRGCGILLYNEKRSRYNYVDQVVKKAKDNYGATLTKEQIYDNSGAYDDLVCKCVEDLIIDEMALELAFEGNRFFDLMRVADRRNDSDYLAKRVASRNGTLNAALYSKLTDRRNWFFHLGK